jgi:uncharacterized delta-60 repeat protein
LSLTAGAALAAPGDADTSFGNLVATPGTYAFSFAGGGDNAEGIAVESDGRIVVAANFGGTASVDASVLRLTEVGVQETRRDLGLGLISLTSVAVHPDGRIFYAGYTKGSSVDFVVGRIDPSTFAKIGEVITPISTVTSNGQPDDRAYAMVIQPDGKIVVVGETAQPSNSGTYTDIAVVRYNSAGDLDQSFGDFGKKTVHIGGSSASSIGYGVALQADGKIVIAGTTHNGNDLDFAVVRLTTTGALDTSFDGDGIQTTNVGPCSNCQPDDVARGVAVQADGKIVLAGYADIGVVDSDNPNNNTIDTRFALVRFNANGSLDTAGFGTNGKLLDKVSGIVAVPGTSIGPQDRAFGLAIQNDGMIVVVGESRQTDQAYDRALVRYQSNGQFDAGFGPAGTGKVVADRPSGFSFSDENSGRALALQSDGKILTTGVGAFTFVNRWEGTPVISAAANPRDFDADGLSDILWQNTATGQRYAWFMDGLTRKGGAFNIATVPTDWSMAGTGDFDADGQADILWQNTVTGQRNVWYMNGAVRKGGAVNFARLSTDWHLAGTADFDADGQPDILWENNVTGQRYVWLMNGVTRKGGAIALGTVPTAWKIAGTGDFDADGKPDILWQNTVTGQRSIWPMDGVARKGATVSLGTFPTVWQIAGVGDYDGDGQPDILWQNTSNGARLAWLMNGTTRKGGAITFANIDPLWSIVR